MSAWTFVSVFLTGAVLGCLVAWHEANQRLERQRQAFDVRMGFALFGAGGTDRFTMRCRGCHKLFSFNYELYLLLEKPRVYCPRCRHWHIGLVHAPPGATDADSPFGADAS